MDWIEFKRSFTQQQEDALWQYFIDHSKIQTNGYFSIFFYCRDVNDFWRRVTARANGDFKRYDVETKMRKAEKYLKMTQELAVHRKMSMRNHAIATDIDQGNNLLDKIRLWLYRRMRKELFESGRQWRFKDFSSDSENEAQQSQHAVNP